jgi:hypothetical protein
MKDFNCNYLNDCNKKPFGIESLAVDDQGKFTINGEAYSDPDSKSKKLYENMWEYYFANKSLPNGNFLQKVEIAERTKDDSSFYELVVDITGTDGSELIAKVGLGADYIGPSVYWANEAKMNNGEIATFLLTTRTFGGHILWPRWIGIPKKNGMSGFDFIDKKKPGSSVNTERGGEKGFYDRIDLTLFDLSEWYLGQVCKLKKTFDESKIWFNQFIDFRRFIDFFMMIDYVCKVEYRIKNLCSYYQGSRFEYLTSKDVYPSTIPSDIYGYKKFSDANIYLIDRRNKLFILKQYATKKQKPG